MQKIRIDTIAVNIGEGKNESTEKKTNNNQIHINPQKRKIKKEQERRKNSGVPARVPAGKSLKSRNPAAADANNDGHQNHKNKNHQDRITRDKSNNGIEPTKNSCKNCSNVRNQSGKSTSSRRRLTFSFLISLFMVNEPQSPNTHESNYKILTDRRAGEKVESVSNRNHFKAPRSHVTMVTKVRTTMTKAAHA